MSESAVPPPIPADDSESARIPEDLPPVEPPSAGFIVQLFVVPGLIVLAVIGVWLLFGKLASSEEDWRQQVEELRNVNEHRRWRGALGLAQMLRANRERNLPGEKLSSQPELARALATALTEELKQASPNDKELEYQAFLTRTLGLFDLPDEVFPVLRQAIQSRYDREVRKNALGSIALISSREAAAGRPVSDASLVKDLVEISTDEDRLIRQTATYTLALVPTSAALDQLAALVDDVDRNTRANAAVGLARNHDLRGLKVLKSLLEQALANPAEVLATSKSDPGKADEFENFVAVKNAIAAIQNLAPELSVNQRHQFRALLVQVADTHKEPKIATDARSAAMQLDAAEPKKTK